MFQLRLVQETYFSCVNNYFLTHGKFLERGLSVLSLKLGPTYPVVLKARRDCLPDGRCAASSADGKSNTSNGRDRPPGSEGGDPLGVSESAVDDWLEYGRG